MTTKATASQPPVRIVCADPQPLFTLGVRSLLSAERGLHVVGEASTADGALRIVERLKPDVLLLDLALDAAQAVNVLGRLALRKTVMRTIVIGDEFDPSDLRVALLRGARGVMRKDIEPKLLVKCIRQVVAGEFWIARHSVADLVEALRNPVADDPPAFELSDRERDIVSAVIKGKGNKEIASQLGMGEQTVKNHLRRIFAKLRVTNRVELAIKLQGKI